MKGGKRLSEEERVEWFGFVHAQNNRMATPERRMVIYKEIIDDLEAWLERDDEPEFCTCEVNKDKIASCTLCGKPIRGK